MGEQRRQQGEGAVAGGAAELGARLRRQGVSLVGGNSGVRGQHGRHNFKPFLMAAGSGTRVFYHRDVSVEASAGLEGLAAVAARQPCPCASGLWLNNLAALSHFREALQ